jgi:hypothetical protein
MQIPLNTLQPFTGIFIPVLDTEGYNLNSSATVKPAWKSVMAVHTQEIFSQTSNNIDTHRIGKFFYFI